MLDHEDVFAEWWGQQVKVSGIKFVQGRNYSADSDHRKYGVAIHNTSNNATAEAEASYATRRTDSVSAHFYADSDSVVQSLDTNVRSWHAGSQNGNDNAVSVEITGFNYWTRAEWLKRVAWDQLGRVLALVCLAHGIPVLRRSPEVLHANPKAGGFYGHDDMRRAWGGTSHTDPGPNFPWDHLLAVVASHINGTPPPPADPGQPDQLVVDGRLGPRTITRWQQVMGTTADGVIDNPSDLTRAVQRHLNKVINAGLVVDGVGIRQDGRVYKTARALQRYVGTEQDGRLSVPDSECIKAVQRRLNKGRF